MKKISNLLVLVLVVFNLTISISFPYVTISKEELETSTISFEDSEQMERNIMTLQSHFPRNVLKNR